MKGKLLCVFLFAGLCLPVLLLAQSGPVATPAGALCSPELSAVLETPPGLDAAGPAAEVAGATASGVTASLFLPAPTPLACTLAQCLQGCPATCAECGCGGACRRKCTSLANCVCQCNCIDP